MMGICDSDGEIEYFLQVVDPYNNQQITFSEVVHLLSAHMVPEEDGGEKSVPMLEKFARLNDEELMNNDL